MYQGPFISKDLYLQISVLQETHLNAKIYVNIVELKVAYCTYNVYWTNKVSLGDQAFGMQFLEDFELLVKGNRPIIKVFHFVSFVHLRVETIVFAFKTLRR